MQEEIIVLADLCREFLSKITNLYINGIITKEEFDNLSKNKINFLKNYGIE